MGLKKRPEIKIAFVKASGMFEIGYLCKVSYKGLSEEYIGSTKEACLLDFIEDLTGTGIKILEKE